MILRIIREVLPREAYAIAPSNVSSAGNLSFLDDSHAK
jgi:hypothetical protein